MSAFAALAIPFGLSFSSGKNPIERLGDGGGSGGVTLSAMLHAGEAIREELGRAGYAPR